MESSAPIEFSKRPGIGVENEGSLHSRIKEWYARPGDRCEESVAGYIVDLVRDGENEEPQLLIEVQTRNFAAIRKKLYSLVKKHRVCLIYPIAKERWIIRQTSSGVIKSKRRSPKKGVVTDLFSELVRIPGIINEENFILEVLLVAEEQIWCEDGKGSWRRKGVSIKDRRLVNVFESIQFKNKYDFLRLLPPDLDEPFTCKNLAQKAGINIHIARKAAYCLKKMGAIKEVGKLRNELLYKINPDLERVP